MLMSKVCHTFQTGRPIRTSNLVHKRSMKSRITDKHHDPPSSKVNVARSRDPSVSCWPILQEQKVPETPKLVERLPNPRTITRTRFEVKRSKVKFTRLINLKPKVRYLRTSNLVGDCVYQLPWPASL